MLRLIHIMFFFFLLNEVVVHKLRYKRYLELICRCLSDFMLNELTRIRIVYGDIIYVYEKAHVTVV